MIQEIITQIVKKYPFLKNATVEKWKESIKVLELKKGSNLVKEGEFTDKLYYIYQGGAKACYLKEGKTISDWFAFEGSFICAITGYFLKDHSQHSIELTENSILLEFKREDMDRLSKNYHDFEHFSRIAITKIMLKLQQRIVSLQFTTAQERYNDLLQNYPDIELRVSLGDIASFIGITQETLSRIRALEP